MRRGNLISGQEAMRRAALAAAQARAAEGNLKSGDQATGDRTKPDGQGTETTPKPEPGAAATTIAGAPEPEEGEPAALEAVQEIIRGDLVLRELIVPLVGEPQLRDRLQEKSAQLHGIFPAKAALVDQLIELTAGTPEEALESQIRAIFELESVPDPGDPAPQAH